jgi:hypothetical protein
MRKARILLFLGLWVTIIPYTGFPYSWKDILTTLSGLVLVYFSYTLYSEYKAKEKKKKSFDNFKENTNFKEIVTKKPEENFVEKDVIGEQFEEEVRPESREM